MEPYYQGSYGCDSGAYCSQETLQELDFDSRKKRFDLIKNPITTRPGFHSLNENWVPDAVRKASKSVYSIFVFSIKPELSDDQTPSLVGTFKDFYHPPARLDSFFDQMIRAHIGACPEKGGCQVSWSGMASGSAFLVGESGRELWTANHIFTPVTENGVLEDLKNIEIYIFDENQKLVAHPFNNSFRLVSTANAGPIPRDGSCAMDFVKLELKNPIGRGLRLAKEVPEAGAPVYHLGYPNRTGDERDYKNNGEWLNQGTRYPFPDAKGETLSVTAGVILPQHKENMILSNADGTNGMSGGVGVNEEGEALAIFVMDIPKLVYEKDLPTMVTTHATCSTRPFSKLERSLSSVHVHEG